MKFKAKVIPSGNATGVEVPKRIVEARRSRLPFGLKRKHVAAIDGAKTQQTRQRRIAALVASLSERSRT